MHVPSNFSVNIIIIIIITIVIILYSPVFIREAGAVGPHSELAEELTEPFLDVDPLLSAFIHAGSLSSSETVTVVHSRVVKARHSRPSRWTNARNTQWMQSVRRKRDRRLCFAVKTELLSVTFPRVAFTTPIFLLSDWVRAEGGCRWKDRGCPKRFEGGLSSMERWSLWAWWRGKYKRSSSNTRSSRTIQIRMWPWTKTHILSSQRGSFWTIHN